MFKLYGPNSVNSTAANASTSDMSLGSSEDDIQYIEPKDLPFGVTIAPQLSRQEDYPSDKENCPPRSYLQSTQLDNDDLSDTDGIFNLEYPAPTPALADPRAKPLAVRVEQLTSVQYDQTLPADLIATIQAADTRLDAAVRVADERLAAAAKVQQEKEQKEKEIEEQQQIATARALALLAVAKQDASDNGTRPSDVRQGLNFFYQRMRSHWACPQSPIDECDTTTATTSQWINEDDDEDLEIYPQRDSMQLLQMGLCGEHPSGDCVTAGRGH